MADLLTRQHREADSFTICDFQAVFWGTLGPHKMFGPGGQYTMLLIGFPVGFIIPIIVYFAMKRFPRQTWLRQIHPIPLIAGGIAWAPYNLSYTLPALPWSLLSMVYLKKRYLPLWSKYNYTISAALSSAIALSGVFIFFVLQFPGFEFPEWWGNAADSGCEAKACRRFIVDPLLGFGPAPGEFPG